MLSLIIVALSVRKVDLRVDEVQGVINQVGLSGRSMKGCSGTHEASHGRGRPMIELIEESCGCA